MKINSLMKQGVDWIPIEVEVSLQPGAPAVQFLGLPDTLAKESIHRIKSIFQECGLNWPRTEKITINLRPSHLKKESKGIDLALAVALIKASDQLRDLEISKDIFVYGELDLSGRVHVPSDLKSFEPKQPQVKVLTGATDQEFFVSTLQVKNLTQLSEPIFVEAARALDGLKIPSCIDIRVSKVQAQLVKLLAAGEHSIMIAGPSGSGKTTLAEALKALLRPPTEEEFRRIRKIHRYFSEDITWRPFINPHHTTPPISMIGGSLPITPGELTRAHGGALLMDEFLEFSPRVQEALREPIEKGVIRVARGGEVKRLPAQFQLVATTNLCPCGKFVPKQAPACRFGLRKCRAYLERLSGPILDRFDILAFSTDWQLGRDFELGPIKDQVSKTFEFQAQQGRRVINARLEIDELMPSLCKSAKDIGLTDGPSSLRRKRALLRVARTLADLDRSEEIQIKHLGKARQWALRPFYEVEMLG